ncbi:hypothetical protein HanIR_Chr17g0868171 [Helianthus annuus]|nr:hypothetical protein HanIR_Chr17g0868171 [Helianthus annuus]
MVVWFHEMVGCFAIQDTLFCVVSLSQSVKTLSLLSTSLFFLSLKCKSLGANGITRNID